MAKKTMAPTEAQADFLRSKGLDPHFVEIVRDSPHSMIIKHIPSNILDMIEK